MEERQLLQMLVNAKKLTVAQAKQVNEMQALLKGPVSSVIIKLGFLKNDELTSFIAQQEGLKVADLEGIIIPENLVKSVPREIIEKYEVFPVSRKGNTLTLAMSDPKDFNAIQEVAFATNCRIEVALASHSAIAKVITQFFDQADTQKKELDDLGVSDQESDIVKALVTLLIEKRVFTESELKDKVQALSILSVSQKKN